MVLLKNLQIFHLSILGKQARKIRFTTFKREKTSIYTIKTRG